MIKEILKTLRINHYIKNLIILVPLVFSMQLTNLQAGRKTIVMILSFCFISSVVYILNDLVDIKNDQQHPVKCRRPVASGKIHRRLAVTISILLLAVSLVLSALLNKACILTILCYLVLNIFYSLKLKNIVLVDVLCIALGFILRILSGCFAISVIPSPLVILLTFFLSMFFTFSKRTLEAKMLDKELCRHSLKNFDIMLLKQFIIINAILTIAFYFNYMLDPLTIEKTGCQYLYITTIPFTMLMFRLIYLIFNSKEVDDPVHFIYKDKTVKSFIVIYLAVLFIILNF